MPLDPYLVRARQVPWEPLACLKDTRRRFPIAHGGTRRACFPMRGPNPLRWTLSFLGLRGEPVLSWSLE
jgi:hypothetical protein